MNFVLAFPLILSVLSRGHGLVTVSAEAHKTCFEWCPAGYHTTGKCSDPSDSAAKFKCEKCGENTFTDIKNSRPKCERCQSCPSDQDTIKPCTFNSSVKCDCRNESYNVSPSSDNKQCKPCAKEPGADRKDTPDYYDYMRKCNPCQRAACLEKPECRSRYRCEATPPVPPASTTSSTMLTAFRNVMPTKSSSSTLTPPVANLVPVSGGHMYWLLWLAVTFAVISGLLMLRRRFGAPENCPYWSVQKAVTPRTDDARLNEQHSHEDNTSTTVTINPCEETPIMSPFTSEHPAPASTLLPSTELRAAKLEDQSKHWPAIVLYAIIKEVPLRRWKEFLRLLSVADEQLERVELEAGLGLGSMEKQYLMLRLWSQRASASLDDVFSALQYMDLSRCAELLEENLETLQWRTETKQGVTD